MNKKINTNTKLPALTAFLHIVLVWLFCVVVIDVVGVAVVFVTEVIITRFSSALLFYAIWLVAGIFCGMYFIGYTHEKAIRNPLIAARPWLIPVAGAALTVIAIYTLHLLNELDAPGAGDHWVPGHKGLTLTFFISFSAASFFFEYVMREKQGGGK